MHDQQDGVEQWLYDYSTEPNLLKYPAVLVITVLVFLGVWIHFARTRDTRSQDVMFIVLGTPMMATTIQVVYRMHFPHDETPPLAEYAAGLSVCIASTDAFIKETLKMGFVDKTTQNLQLVLFVFGAFKGFKILYEQTKHFHFPDLTKVALSKSTHAFLVCCAVLLLPMAQEICYYAYVLLQCAGIVCSIMFCWWGCHGFPKTGSTVKTKAVAKTGVAKTGVVKTGVAKTGSTVKTHAAAKTDKQDASDNKEKLTIRKTTPADTIIWNKMCGKPGMKDIVEYHHIINAEHTNLKIRQDVLIAYIAANLSEYISVDDKREKE